MSYDNSFYLGLRNDLNKLGYQRIVKQAFPPALPAHSREAIFSHENHYGGTGTGKTVALLSMTIEKYLLKAPKFGVNGFKIFEIDLLGKGELACCFHPIDSSHPLYEACQEIGLEPESYPVEVLRPLVYIRGQPDLLYEQPDIVKPFTLALSDVSLVEWGTILPGGLSPGQSNLLSKALKEIEDIESASIYDLYVKCQEIVESGNVGYGTHVEQMKNTPLIPLTKAVFSGREGKGLLQKLEVISDTGLIQPKFWKGKSVTTNINLAKVLSDQETISVLIIPKYRDLPHLNFGIINYFLNHIYYLKNPNNASRVTQPLCIVIPELRNLVPKHIESTQRYYVEKVKATMLDLVSAGAGMGICLLGDTQSFEQIEDEYRTNVKSVFIFDLGEEAAEKIKELVKNRYVSNFKEITDNYHLSALKDIGTFIYLGYGSIRAEIHKNAVVGFWYPRSRGKAGETETNYYTLFKRVYPKRMVNIGGLYSLILQINVDRQTLASQNMHVILEEKRVREKKSKSEKQLAFKFALLSAVQSVCEKESKSNFEYAEITYLLGVILEKSAVQIQRYLKKLAVQSFLIIDSSQGFKKKKVLVNRNNVKKELETLKAELEE